MERRPAGPGGVVDLEQFGRLVGAKRGQRGVRAAAADIGISHATLARVENGFMPDLETFAKICRWLGVDPREFLGIDAETDELTKVSVHFRKKRTQSKETATALGELILAAQKALGARVSGLDR